MLYYFDTSAIVPLLLTEPTSGRCRAVWNRADLVASSSLSLVEARASLARATKAGRIAPTAHRSAVVNLEALWADIAAIPPTPEVLRTAAALATSHAMRGYDAVQCSSALALASDDLIAVSGDHELLRAWGRLGIATAAVD